MMLEKKKYPYDVLVVGELNIDLILNRIGGFPEMSKEILADEMVYALVLVTLFAPQESP